MMEAVVTNGAVSHAKLQSVVTTNKPTASLSNIAYLLYFAFLRLTEMTHFYTSLLHL